MRLRNGWLDVEWSCCACGSPAPQPVRALDRFGRFFLGELWTVYGPGIVHRPDHRNTGLPQ